MDVKVREARHNGLHFDSANHTYTLNVTMHVHVWNENFYPVTVVGRIDILFFDQEAGCARLLRDPSSPDDFGSAASNITCTRLASFDVGPRVSTHREFAFDGSSIPKQYVPTLIQEAELPPYELVFLVSGMLTAEGLWRKHDDSVDSYFLISTASQKTRADGERHPSGPSLVGGRGT